VPSFTLRFLTARGSPSQRESGDCGDPNSESPLIPVGTSIPSSSKHSTHSSTIAESSATAPAYEWANQNSRKTGLLNPSTLLPGVPSYPPPKRCQPNQFRFGDREDLTCRKRALLEEFNAVPFRAAWTGAGTLIIKTTHYSYFYKLAVGRSDFAHPEGKYKGLGRVCRLLGH